MFSLDEKQPNDATALALVQSVSMISEVDSGLLTTWLNRIIVGSVTDKEMTGKMADNRLLLQSIVSFLVKEQRYNIRAVYVSIPVYYSRFTLEPCNFTLNISLDFVFTCFKQERQCRGE